MTERSERAFRLELHGPLLEVDFAVGEQTEAALREAGRPVPGPVRLLALVDTGSNLTGVRRGTLARPGVHPTTVLRFRTAERGGIDAPAYLGRILFPGGVKIPTTAGELNLPDPRIGCILGRNVLGHGRLLYDGREGSCTLVLKGVEIPLPEPPAAG